MILNINNYFINTKYYELFINNAQYWLSSRYVYCSNSVCEFGIRNVDSKNVGGMGVYNSRGESQNASYSFLPIITLNLDIKLSGDSTSGWTIQ